jgi:hypothetical protein
MGRACSKNWEQSNSYRILVEKPEGKRPIGRPKCRWEDCIKMGLKRTRMERYGMDSARLMISRSGWHLWTQ